MGGETALPEQNASGAEVFDVVHARILRFFPDLVDALGGDPTLLMQRVGIRSDKKPSAHKSGTTYRQMVHLIELAATQLRCPDFGMRPAMLQNQG